DCRRPVEKLPCWPPSPAPAPGSDSTPCANGISPAAARAQCSDPPPLPATLNPARPRQTFPPSPGPDNVARTPLAGQTVRSTPVDLLPWCRRSPDDGPP